MTWEDIIKEEKLVNEDIAFDLTLLKLDITVTNLPKEFGSDPKVEMIDGKIVFNVEANTRTGHIEFYPIKVSGNLMLITTDEGESVRSGPIDFEIDSRDLRSPRMASSMYIRELTMKGELRYSGSMERGGSLDFVGDVELISQGMQVSNMTWEDIVKEMPKTLVRECDALDCVHNNRKGFCTLESIKILKGSDCAYYNKRSLIMQRTVDSFRKR